MTTHNDDGSIIEYDYNCGGLRSALGRVIGRFIVIGRDCATIDHSQLSYQEKEEQKRQME